MAFDTVRDNNFGYYGILCQFVALRERWSLPTTSPPLPCLLACPLRVARKESLGCSGKTKTKEQSALSKGARSSPFPRVTTCERTTNLVAQPLDPPYRAIGYSYTYCTYVCQVLQVLRCTPQIGPIAAEGSGWQRVSQLKLPSGGYRATRGYR